MLQSQKLFHFSSAIAWDMSLKPLVVLSPHHRIMFKRKRYQCSHQSPFPAEKQTPLWFFLLRQTNEEEIVLNQPLELLIINMGLGLCSGRTLLLFIEESTDYYDTLVII